MKNAQSYQTHVQQIQGRHLSQKNARAPHYRMGLVDSVIYVIYIINVFNLIKVYSFLRKIILDSDFSKATPMIYQIRMWGTLSYGQFQELALFGCDWLEKGCPEACTSPGGTGL